MDCLRLVLASGYGFCLLASPLDLQPSAEILLALLVPNCNGSSQSV